MSSYILLSRYDHLTKSFLVFFLQLFSCIVVSTVLKGGAAQWNEPTKLLSKYEQWSEH